MVPSKLQIGISPGFGNFAEASQTQIPVLYNCHVEKGGKAVKRDFVFWYCCNYKPFPVLTNNTANRTTTTTNGSQRMFSTSSDLLLPKKNKTLILLSGVETLLLLATSLFLSCPVATV